MGDRPKMFRENMAYSETQRTVDRAFLFRPDEVIRQLIGSSAGRALRKHPVRIYWLEFNINHLHRGIAPLSTSQEDLRHYLEFTKMFNSLVAKGINRILKRQGAVYSTSVRSTETIRSANLEQQLFYAVTNVVKDGLVDKVSHWRGFSLYNQMATGIAEKFQYIDYPAWRGAGGKRSGKKPSAFLANVTIELSPMPHQQHWSPAKRQSHFRREVRAIEKDCREKREALGHKPMGPTKLAKLDPRDRPKTLPVRTRKPLCHASTKAERDEYKKGYRDFPDSGAGCGTQVSTGETGW